jgi:DEAD/DEAH box helicase domain-containing protein
LSSRLAAGLSTGHLLDEMGYEYYHFSSPRQSPELTEVSFSDLLPQLLNSSSERCRAIASAKLYSHQREALEALGQGLNVILSSGTGSGKTEAWFLYLASKGKRALAVYPTLALANDQLNRLREYAAALNMEVLALDALKRDQYVKTIGFKELRRRILTSHLVVTNPAFLLNELKKIGANRPSLLRQFLQEANLLVIDDFDFYGPRSIALLFSMVKLLVKYVNQKLQLCFLTAGLENPEDVAEHLTSINQRKTAIIEGRAFRPENHYYIVLGKNLRKIWELLRARRQELEAKGVGEDILRLLESYEGFREECYRVLEVAQAAGLDIGELGLDPLPLLAKYAEEDGLTLVFTRGIARAEEISRQLSLKFKNEGVVASHHHLLSKELREKLEEEARRGALKIIVSPKTLSQGIDIGPIRRVVHIGLPDSVREFKQKEGRKGRRQEVLFTETVIFPSGPWTFSLLSKGVEVVKKWIEMPSEKIIVNRENLYSRLFEGLFLLSSPLFRTQLGKEDRLFLRSLGLERDGELTEAGKQAWLKLNFYEFAPPFGIKRLRLRNARDLEQLEDISHVDLVEKFQIGCLDYSSDGVVVEHRFGGSRARIVTSVLVDDIREAVLRRHEALSHVLEEYERIKRGARERADLYGDYLNGRIHTEVLCAVHVPSNGFGLYSKIPNRVIWRFKLARRRLQVIGDRTLVLQDEKKFVVPTPTSGWYSDYTYGISFETGPEESIELLRLALAFLIILLRRLLGVPFDLIKYDVAVMGNRKLVILHETESAGLLVKINWNRLKALVQGYEPDELDLVFLEEVDELAHASFLSLRLDWALVKKRAIGLLDYLIARERIIVKLKEKELELPRPSRALGLISMVALDLTLREDISSGLYAIGLYDGEEFQHVIGLKELGEPDDAALLALERLSGAINRGSKLLVYDLRDAEANLSAAGLTSLRAYLLGISQLGMITQVYGELRKYLGEGASLDVIEQALGLQRSIRLQDLRYELENEARRMPSVSFIRLKQSRFRDKIASFLQEEAKSLYLSYLVLRALEERESSKQGERSRSS